MPHKSKTNNSKFDRRTLYYTYLNKKFGYQYENYFLDKKLSKQNIKKFRRLIVKFKIFRKSYSFFKPSNNLI